MSMKHHIRNIRNIQITSLAKFSLTALLYAACSSPVATQKQATTSADGSPKLGDDTVTLQNVEKVSALSLDNSNFRVNGLRTGLQDFMTGATPVLNYMLPEKADYLEIIRCKSDAIIRGPTADLSDVDLGSPSTDDETRIFKQNNFWDAALSQINNCVLVSGGFSSKSFQDLNVRSGSYRYLARACISTERLTDIEYTSKRNCSRQIAISNILADYKNLRDESTTTALQRVQDLRDKVDGLGREIFYLTVATNNALAVCDNQESDRQARVKRKEALSKILGIGLSLGLELSLPTSGIAAVHSGAKTWTQLWSETWDNRDSIAGQGLQIGQALQWLFSSASDFPRSCTTAKELAMQADTKTDELKNTHKELAAAADEAEVAHKNQGTFGEGK